MTSPRQQGVQEPGWARFDRVGNVRACQLTTGIDWLSGSGDRMVGKVGDWMVTDGTGGRRSVTDESFRATHRHLSDDRWERFAVVTARPAVPGEGINTSEGAAVATAGDWLVRDADGAEWFVPDNHFLATYRRTGAE